MKQVHEDHILVLKAGTLSDLRDGAPADAMITNRPGVGLMVKQADCQAVILFDPKKQVLANVHCGWRGHVKNILGKTVRKMKAVFGCRPSDLVAGVGPSLGPCCAEFITFREIFPRGFERFMVRENYFDLWALSRFQLEEAGLRPENIAVTEICTRCRTDLFFSYRGEGKTGRFGTVAALRK